MCTPDFSAPTFFAWMAAYRPTWYSAVPTMHQAILAHAAAHRQIIADAPLRFIRSSSAFLPPQVLAELESVFNVPVIEAYGTTEASMITCNPLPPRRRKAGSGGMAVGQEVAIMDAVGSILPPSTVGEVVVRGAAVMQGYENNPVANRSAFTHSWFRTGDVGYLDADGYLFITGRIKEIINRGGEKIAPREIEEVLMKHPAVAEVTAFAMPHAQLGEEVAAAIVLRENASATAREIHEFAGARLPDFKVPRQVIFVDEIPKGATGKVQRNGLAAELGLSIPDSVRPEPAGTLVAPRTSWEALLVEIWRSVLDVDHVGVYDNFFDLGGHSLLAMQVITMVEKRTGLRIYPRDLMFQTLGQLAAACDEQRRLGQPTEPVSFIRRMLHLIKGAVSHRTGDHTYRSS